MKFRSSEIDSFIIAAETGQIDQVKNFIEKGMPVDAENQREETALNMASVKGKLEVVEYLLSVGANPNHGNDNNNTALIHAACYNHLDIVELLLKHGADKSHSGSNGTAADWAVEYGNEEVAEFLKHYKPVIQIEEEELGWFKVDDNNIECRYIEGNNTRHITDMFNFEKQERTRCMTFSDKEKPPVLAVTAFKDIQINVLQEAFNELVAKEGTPKPDSIPGRVVRVISRRKKDI